jgi:hypothetical protein
MIHSSSILAVSLLATLTVGNPVFIPKNDWSKPCFNGVCTWDHPVQTSGKNAGSSGSMKIWGSPDAISDVTEAGGWMILDCEKDKMAQDIRLVCKNDDGAEDGCGHLSRNMSPEGKIVRLPNSCGKMPFARVGKWWTPEDQSIPQETMKKIVRRAGVPAQVKAMTIDTDFASGDVKKTGNVSLAVQGVNFPGNPAGSVNPTGGPQRRSRLAERGLFDFVGDVINKIGDAAKTVVDTVEKGVDTVVKGTEQVIDTVKNATTINENTNKTLAPIDVDKSFPIFSGTVNCPGFSASLNADVATKAHAVVTIGVAAIGSIIPPKFDDFSVFAGLDADINGALHVAAQASGQVTSGPQTLFEVGVPGLDFPGILQLGPSFKINGNVIANLDVDVDMTVNLAYNVKNAQMFFPPSDKHKSGGDFKPADSNLKLSATPSIAAQGTLEGHLIPTIDLGINALAGVAQATVFLDLDASAVLALQLNAGANITKETGKKAAVKDAGVDGCVDISAGLSVDVGATAGFFGFFNAGTKDSLFAKKFDLFKKCFSQGTPPGSAANNAVDAGAAAANQTQADATAGADQSTDPAADPAATSTDTVADPAATATDSAADPAATSTDLTAAVAATSGQGAALKASRTKAKGLKKQTKRALACGAFTGGLGLANIVTELISAASIKAI